MHLLSVDFADGKKKLKEQAASLEVQLKETLKANSLQQQQWNSSIEEKDNEILRLKTKMETEKKILISSIDQLSENEKISFNEKLKFKEEIGSLQLELKGLQEQLRGKLSSVRREIGLM